MTDNSAALCAPYTLAFTRDDHQAAAAALLAAIERDIGPVEPFYGATDTGTPYVGFDDGTFMVASVEPYGDGWAVLWDARGGFTESRVMGYGETPVIAMQRAAESGTPVAD